MCQNFIYYTDVSTYIRAHIVHFRFGKHFTSNRSLLRRMPNADGKRGNGSRIFIIKTLCHPLLELLRIAHKTFLPRETYIILRFHAHKYNPGVS